MAQVLDGTLTAESITQKALAVIQQVQQKHSSGSPSSSSSGSPSSSSPSSSSLSSSLPPAPSLAILQVGDDPASKAYIGSKVRLAEKIGIRCEHFHLSRQSSREEVEAQIQSLANNAAIDAMIVQLPMILNEGSTPAWENKCIEMIPASKDADGLVSKNLGILSTGVSTARNWTAPLPATAYGIMELFEQYQISLKGKRVLVLGKSRLVGLPAALLCLHEGATVTTAHSQSGDWSDLSRRADIIIVATGMKHLLKEEHIKEGVVIIDVGIHRSEDGLTGDVCHSCYEKAAAYSPVPGGVGRLTVACLMLNTVRLWAATHNP